MSDNTLSSGYNGQRNDYYIDEAAANERLSQRFRQGAAHFASERGICLRSIGHAQAFLRYFRDARRVDRLLAKAARRFGYSASELEEAFSILYRDFSCPSDIASAKMLLHAARESLAGVKPSLSIHDAQTRPVPAAEPQANPPAKRQAARQKLSIGERSLPAGQRRSLKFIRSVAKENGFTEEDTLKAFGLCQAYNWFPYAGPIAITRSAKHRKERALSETLDILSQARHGYACIEDIARRGMAQPGAAWGSAVESVRRRYEMLGKRVVSEQVLEDLSAEFSFSKYPAAYAYELAKSLHIPAKAAMEISSRLSGKPHRGADPLPPRHATESPRLYCERLLRGAASVHAKQPLPSPRVLSADEIKKNYNILNDLNRGRKAAGLREYPARVLILAQDSAKAKGRAFTGIQEASIYAARAEKYLAGRKQAYRLIKKASKNGYSREEQEAALALCEKALVLPSSEGEAQDFLLQARLASECRAADYIWSIAESGGYPYEIALEVESRYLYAGVPLTHEQVIASFEEEKAFRADTYKFVNDVARVINRENRLLGKEPEFTENGPLITGLAYTLRNYIAHGKEAFIPQELFMLPRHRMVRRILTGREEYSKLLEAKWEQYNVSHQLVMKAAQDYQHVDPEEMSAGAAAEEAIRRVREDGERLRNLAEAKALFGDCLWAIKNRRELHSRVTRGMLPQDIADAAWGIIYRERRSFSSLDEELSFYSELFSERGLPYPGKLMAYLSYKWGRISRELATEAISRLESAKHVFANEEEAMLFLDGIKMEMAEAEEKKGGVARKPVRSTIAYAETVLDSEGGLMFRLPDGYPTIHQFRSGQLARVPDSEAEARLAAPGPAAAKPVPANADEAATAVGPTVPAMPAPAVERPSGPVQAPRDSRDSMALAKVSPVPLEDAVQRGPPAQGQPEAHPGLGFRVIDLRSSMDASPAPAPSHEAPVAPAPAAAPVAPSSPLSESIKEDACRLKEAQEQPRIETLAGMPVPSLATPQAKPQLAGAAPSKPEEVPLPPELGMAVMPEIPSGEDVADRLDLLSAPPAAPPGEPKQEEQRPTVIFEPPYALIHEAMADATPSPPEEDATEHSPTIVAPEGQMLVLAAASRAQAQENETEMKNIVLLMRRLYGSRDTAARLAAAEALASIGTQAALFGLAGAIEGSGPVSEYASSVLESRGEDAIPALSSILMEGPGQGKLSAIKTLAAIGKQPSFGAIAPVLQDDEPGTACEAAFQMLLANGRGLASVATHFHALPDGRAAMLLDAMLSGRHAAAEEEAKVVRYESAKLLAEMLRSRPGFIKSVSRETWIQAIGEWVRIGTQDSFDSVALALRSGDESIASEAAFQLLLAHGTGRATAFCHFKPLPEDEALAIMKRMLLGVHSKMDEDTRVVRLNAAKYLAEMAENGCLPSKVYPILCTAIGETDAEISEFLMEALHKGGFDALPHLEAPLFTSSELVVGRAAELFLTAKGSVEEVYWANQTLLRAAFEKEQVMGLMKSRGQEEMLARVLLDSTANVRARHAAAILLNEKSAKTAVPLMLEAYMGALKFDDKDHADLRESLIKLLSGRKREPEAEVPVFLSFYALCPALQDHIFAMLSRCEPGKAVPAALRESKGKGRAYDGLIERLIEEEYGPASLGYAVDYAEKEFPRASGEDNPAEHAMAIQEAGFLANLISSEMVDAESELGRAPSGQARARADLARENAARLLRASLHLFSRMDDGRKAAICQFAVKTGPKAVPAILGYARAEKAAGRFFGDFSIAAISRALNQIRDKEGAEFFGLALPEASGLSREALDSLRDLGTDLDAVAAEKMLLEYAGSRAAARALGLDEALALLSLAKSVGCAASAVSERHESGSARMLAYVLPLLNEMDRQQMGEVISFALAGVLGEGVVGQIGNYINSRGGEMGRQETVALAAMLARINTDSSFALLTSMLEAEKRKDILDAVEEELSESYSFEAMPGVKPVRETILRAAFGRKVPGREAREYEGRLTNLGLIAFNSIAANNDASKDVINGCRDAHFYTAEDADRSERMFYAREMLASMGDEAIRAVNEVIFSADFPRYPAAYRAHLLRTVSHMAANSSSRETKELAKQSLFEAVLDTKLEAGLVAGVLRTMNADVLRGLSELIPADTSAAPPGLEGRICEIARLMGDAAYSQAAKLLSSGDPSDRAHGALMLGRMAKMEPGLARLMRREPGERPTPLQAAYEMLPKLLMDQEERVRVAAENALDSMGAAVPLQKLEEVVRSKRDRYYELLSFEMEANPRIAAARLMAKAGESAIESFMNILTDRTLNEQVYCSCLEISMSLGDRMLERLLQDEKPLQASPDGRNQKEVEARNDVIARDSAWRATLNIREKYLLLHAATRCSSPFGQLLYAMWCGDREWHQKMESLGLRKGVAPPQWQLTLLKLFVVEGVVLRSDNVAADVAHSLMCFYNFFGPKDIAKDCRDAVDNNLRLCGWFPSDRANFSFIKRLEERGIDTAPIKDAIMGMPSGPDDTQWAREMYRGFVRNKVPPKRPPMPAGTGPAQLPPKARR